MNRDEKTPPTGPHQVSVSKTTAPHRTPPPPSSESAPAKPMTPLEAMAATLRSEARVRDAERAKAANLDRLVLSRFGDRIAEAESKVTGAVADASAASVAAIRVERRLGSAKAWAVAGVVLAVLVAGFAWAGARRVARLTERVEMIEAQPIAVPLGRPTVPPEAIP